MSAIEAKSNYTGIGGCPRMNCAQSVMRAFKEKFNIEDSIVDSSNAYGSGRAPGGVCGAYYAAKCIADIYNKEKVGMLEKYFSEQAGALECINIKGLKKLSCVGCVEKSSEFLEKL